LAFEVNKRADVRGDEHERRRGRRSAAGDLDANAFFNTSDTIVFDATAFATKTIPHQRRAENRDSLTIRDRREPVDRQREQRQPGLQRERDRRLSVSISGMTITGEVDRRRRHLRRRRKLALDRVVVSGNSATSGSGRDPSRQPRELTLTNSTVSGNTASVHGGGIYYSAAAS
jgi:hypothetical protein